MDVSERLVKKDAKEQHRDLNTVPHISLSLVDCWVFLVFLNTVPHISLSLVDCWVFLVFSCEQKRDDLSSNTQELMLVRDQAKKV